MPGDSENRNSRNLCDGWHPIPFQEQEVEEAAMPGQLVRTRARFQFPLAIHPRELPAAASVTANHRSTAVESSNVFAESTLRQRVANGNTKTFHACAEAVEDESCLWKAEENSAENQASKMRGEENGITCTV
jgi:hypothetical protein